MTKEATFEFQQQSLKPKLSKDGSIHWTDEFYNTLISSIGALLAIIGSTYLVYQSIQVGKFWNAFSFGVYGFGVISVFISSALHHGYDGTPEVNHFFRELDYCAIFLMIAGTFTPFCVIALKSTLGWFTLGLVWTLALLGIFFRVRFPGFPKWVMITLCIGMGWLALLIVKPLYLAIHFEGIFGLLLGGVFFTGGGIIFGLEKPNPFPGRFGFHEIWHGFVVAGAASHFYTMLIIFK